MKHLTKKDLVKLLDEFPDDYIVNVYTPIETYGDGTGHWSTINRVHDRFCGEDQVGMVTIEVEDFLPHID